MNPSRRWLGGLGLALGVCALAAGVLLSLVPSGAELKQRLEAALGEASGVKVSVGAVRWQLRPLPVLVVDDLTTEQPEPVRLKKIRLYPNLSALWQRSFKLDLVELEGAVLPQPSLRGLGRLGSSGVPVSGEAASAQATSGSPAVLGPANGWSLDDLPVSRVVFRDVSWISRSGVAVAFDGEASFDAAWRPRTAQLRRPGAQPVFDISLKRQGLQDRWSVLVNAGGGTAHGDFEVQTLAKGRLRLAGQLAPQGIEVASALKALNRDPVIEGRASGSTTLSASGDHAMGLAQSLRTQTSFTMGPSTLLNLDLGKAVRSLGKTYVGQTRLDSVVGQLETQNTPEGMVINLTRIKATSGVLSASGQARLINRQIDAEVSVDLLDGVVGVPLKISGPLDKVTVSAPAGAVAGAVVGTAVLPGVGTAIGARLGAAMGKLLGPAASPVSAPPTANAPATATAPRSTPAPTSPSR